MIFKQAYVVLVIYVMHKPVSERERECDSVDVFAGNVTLNSCEIHMPDHFWCNYIFPKNTTACGPHTVERVGAGAAVLASAHVITLRAPEQTLDERDRRKRQLWKGTLCNRNPQPNSCDPQCSGSIRRWTPQLSTGWVSLVRTCAPGLCDRTEPSWSYASVSLCPFLKFFSFHRETNRLNGAAQLR